MNPDLMEKAKNDESSSDSEEEDQNQLNISQESDQLDPAQKAAHEADTLPMDSAAEKPKEELEPQQIQQQSVPNQVPSVAIANRKNKQIRNLKRKILTNKNPLPEIPTTKQKLIHTFRCPPHGLLGRIFTLTLLPLLLWICCLSMFGKDLAAPPGGPIFLLILLVVTGMILGKLFALVKLPPLLGMLIMGIVLKNIPSLEFDDVVWPKWSSTLRGVALVIILMRAGLGLDPIALKKLSGMVFRLAFSPCLAETLTVAVASHLLLGFPWLWGFMLGFILAAVSPAVVVPCLLQLQEQGYGVAKGIPTLVIAAASVDDVLAISGFTILLGITFKPEADLTTIIFQGPLEAVVGLAFGTFWGLMVTFFPAKDDKNFNLFRFVFLLFGGLLALFGSKKLELSGAGALAVLVMAFVAGVGWRKLGWTKDEDNVVAKYLAHMWIIFQPILFGLIGTEIQISRLDPSTVGLGILVLIIGLVVRIFVSFFAVMGGNLTLRERIFVALAWMPKATVQAAIGPVAYDYALQMSSDSSSKERYSELGLQVLTIAVLVILITAPIGAIAITLSAPKLLSKETQKINNENDLNAIDVP